MKSKIDLTDTKNEPISYADIKIDLKNRIKTSCRIISEETNHKGFCFNISNSLQIWKNYRQEQYLILTKKMKVQSEKKDALKKEPTKPDITLYQEQIRHLNPTKLIDDIEQTVNKELDKIWDTQRTLMSFKYIIKAKTLPTTMYDFLNNESMRKISSENLHIDLLKAIGLKPEEYALPKEILELAQDGLQALKKRNKNLSLEKNIPPVNNERIEQDIKFPVQSSLQSNSSFKPQQNKVMPNLKQRIANAKEKLIIKNELLTFAIFKLSPTDIKNAINIDSDSDSKENKK